MFLLVRMKSSLGKFYGHHHDLVNHYRISVSQMTTICPTCCKHFAVCVLPSFMSYHLVCNQSNTTGATSGAGTGSFMWGLCYSIFTFLCSVLQIDVCSFFFWPLCCLSLFDLRILITPLVSSNSSYSNRTKTRQNIVVKTLVSSHLLLSFVFNLPPLSISRGRSR